MHSKSDVMQNIICYYSYEGASDCGLGGESQAWYQGRLMIQTDRHNTSQLTPAPSIWRLIITAPLSRYHYDRAGISADYCD